MEPSTLPDATDAGVADVPAPAPAPSLPTLPTEASAPTPSTKQALRHAEKPRDASCALADVIASCALSQWRTLSSLPEGDSSIPGSNGLKLARQTVVAALVSVTLPSDDPLDANAKVQCIAIGQGTKFLGPSFVASADASVVVDSHAEVLAKRAFKRFLIGGGRLPEGAFLALYTSSAPCGNSCVKKWAKNSAKGVDTLPHSAFNVSQRREGQVAVSVKGEHILHGEELPAPADGIRLWANGASAASGTTPASYLLEGVDGGSRSPYIASCSDKIASWCVLGVQGSACRALLPAPVFPRYVVVGRKFGDATLRRALCCRLASHKPFQPHVHHPLMLRTSLNLDDSVFSDNDGAQFDSPLCTWWCIGEESLGCINGATGRTPEGGVSVISPQGLREGWDGEGGGGDGGFATYEAAKEGAEDLAALKGQLYSHPKLLFPYPSKHCQPQQRAVKRRRVESREEQKERKEEEVEKQAKEEK